MKKISGMDTDIESIQKEASTRIVHHLMHTLQRDKSTVLVKIDDTDVSSTCWAQYFITNLHDVWIAF